MARPWLVFAALLVLVAASRAVPTLDAPLTDLELRIDGLENRTAFIDDAINAVQLSYHEIFEFVVRQMTETNNRIAEMQRNEERRSRDVFALHTRTLNTQNELGRYTNSLSFYVTCPLRSTNTSRTPAACGLASLPV